MVHTGVMLGSDQLVATPDTSKLSNVPWVRPV